MVNISIVKYLGKVYLLKTSFLQKNVNNSEIPRQISPSIISASLVAIVSFSHDALQLSPSSVEGAINSN